MARKKFRQKYLTVPSVTVGVHVRRTDYQQYLQAVRKEGGLYLSRQFYVDGMDYFRKKYKNPIFIVASDDLKWCRKNLLAPDVQFTFDPISNKPASDILDMTILGKKIIMVRCLWIRLTQISVNFFS